MNESKKDFLRSNNLWRKLDTSALTHAHKKKTAPDFLEHDYKNK